MGAARLEAGRRRVGTRCGSRGSPGVPGAGGEKFSAPSSGGSRERAAVWKPPPAPPSPPLPPPTPPLPPPPPRLRLPLGDGPRAQDRGATSAPSPKPASSVARPGPPRGAPFWPPPRSSSARLPRPRARGPGPVRGPRTLRPGSGPRLETLSPAMETHKRKEVESRSFIRALISLPRPRVERLRSCGVKGWLPQLPPGRRSLKASRMHSDITVTFFFNFTKEAVK